MSDRPLIAPNRPFMVGYQMATNVESPITIIQRLPGISYDISWDTGGGGIYPTGTFSVQVSNTYSQDASGEVLNAGNWTTLPSSSFSGTLPAPAGTAGHGFIDVVGTEAYAIKLVYTRTSGDGYLNVSVAAKVW